MVTKKKILFVITKSVWGGAQRYVYDLTTLLPKDKFDVAVACGPGDKSGHAQSLTDKLKEKEIKVISIPDLRRDIVAWPEIISFFSLLKIFIREKPDVIHLSSSKAGGLGAVAALASKLLTFNLKLLTVFTVHGWAFKENRPPWQKLSIFLASWFSSLFQNRIIVIDRADYQTARWFIPDQKLYLIPHGLGPVNLLPSRLARQRLAEITGCDIPPQTALVGTIAELTSNKGIGYLIEAVAELRLQTLSVNFSVIIIGDGEERQRLQQKIDAADLDQLVTMAGFLPEASRWLSALDIFVLPSVKEGLPYSIMEAMSAELPVIATAVGGIPDLIEHQISGLLVPPKNPEAISQALFTLIQNEDQRRSLGQRAKERLKNYSNIETMMAKTAAVYENG